MVPYTVNLPLLGYPTMKQIEEGASMANRTGVSSIMTIGGGAFSDIGKVISLVQLSNIN